MELHRIERIQTVARARDETFRFFADPHNLEVMTPRWLRFHFLTEPPRQFHAGAEIHYAVRFLGVPVSWRSLIETWEPPRRFIDVALESPYPHWRHTHTFELEGRGGAIVHDEVEYAMPFGPLGTVARLVLVGPILNRIFDYRAEQMKRLL
ncbi:MAG: SRPBCC family protein [Candidatus Binataceae bacterium]